MSQLFSDVCPKPLANLELIAVVFMDFDNNTVNVILIPLKPLKKLTESNKRRKKVPFGLLRTGAIVWKDKNIDGF